MPTIKGYEINPIKVRDSFNRRAQQYANNILKSLAKLGLTEDDVEFSEERIAMRKAPANVTWWIQGEQLYYSYAGCDKFVENLYVVSKVIEAEVNELVNEEKEFRDFVRDFQEEDDVEKQRIEARKTLGLAEDERDLEVINKKYKELAKAAHPDMESGDAEEFKKLNRAHKTLKRELE